MLKKISKVFSYLLTLLIYPDKLSDAVNAANNVEELDSYICMKS